MKMGVIIGVILIVVGFLSLLAFIGTIQTNQENKKTGKISPVISPQIKNEPNKSEAKIEQNENVILECSGRSLCFVGKVTKIIDGDTIIISCLYSGSSV